MVRLQFLNGKREGETIELAEQGAHQVGTARSAKIQLRDKDIAFKHCDFIVEGEGLWVQDLGSPKGVFVDSAKLAENAKQQLSDGQKVTLGSTDIKVLLGAAAAAEAPAAVEEPPSLLPDVEPEAPPEPPPAPKAEPKTAAKAEPAAKAAAGSVDADTLLAELRDVKARLTARDKEVKELTVALDAAAVGSEDKGGFGYGETAAGELEATILELRQQNDSLNAQILERQETLDNVKKDLEDLKRDHEAKLAEEKKKRTALEREVQRRLDEKEAQKSERGGLQADLDEIRKANERLVLENDELRDKMEGLTYRNEQEAAKRGEMVRLRIAEVQAENKRLEESNAELRTLVEAYEEKIDELDEKVEELEGEHEELEKQVDEAREELSKMKSQKEQVEKTLKQRIQRLEERNEEVEGEVQRLRAQGVRVGPEDGDTDLKTRVTIYERWLDDVEAAGEAKRELEKVKKLESEVEALKKRLEEGGLPKDAAALEQRAIEAERLHKGDEKKIERLERKNRELVKANVNAEMAKQEIERKLAELGEEAKKG